jgi:hypothetical protein
VKARIILACLVCLTLAGTACDGDSPSGEDELGPVPTYTTRGVVLEVAEDALVLHHEAIDDYARPNGQITGMDAMVMRFRLEPGIGSDEGGVGDKLEFRFHAGPDEPRFVITEVEKLPADTVLDFRAARPPGRR